MYEVMGIPDQIVSNNAYISLTKPVSKIMLAQLIWSVLQVKKTQPSHNSFDSILELTTRDVRLLHTDGRSRCGIA